MGRDRQDDVARLVPLLDVAVRLDRLVHRVPPIDNRSELAGLDELLQEEDVLLDPSTDPASDPLLPTHRVTTSRAIVSTRKRPPSVAT